MEYEIFGDNLPVAICRLRKGEKVVSQRGEMGWMTSNFKMETHIEGGLFKGIIRKFVGTSLFMTSYTCVNEEGVIAFPCRFPGTILVFDLKPGESIIAHKNSFMCAEKSINISMHINTNLSVGLFGGSGFIMQKLTGPGKVFLEIDGGAVTYDLENEEKMWVDPGHVACFTDQVKMDIRLVRGIRNMLFSGEGLFLSELKGPGTIWLESMPMQNVAKSIAPYLGIGKKVLKNNNQIKEYDTFVQE